MPEIPANKLREVADDDAEPHVQAPVLRFLIQKRDLSQADAADAIESTFGYSVSKSMINRAKQKHDIRAPDADSAFADILGNDDDEPGQPPSFFLSRSDDIAVHPLDTDCYEQTSEGMVYTEWNDSPSTTARFQSLPNPNTDSTTSEHPDSDSSCGTGVLKGSLWRVNRQHREQSLIAPPHQSALNDLPRKYHACCCGFCPEKHFLDGGGGPIDCPNPIPVTLSGARCIYAKTEGTRVADETVGNDGDAATTQYAKLMKADSAALSRDGTTPEIERYHRGKTTHGDISTVLLSLRLSPTDADKRIVTPQRLIRDTKDGWAEARSELPTEATDGLPDGVEHLAYYWTLAGTDTWASPHVHCYLWYADPDDELIQEPFKSAVERFTEAATFPANCHLTDNGELIDGPVRVEHEPLLVDPKYLAPRKHNSAFADVLGEPTGPKRLTEGSDAQSRGAMYVGTQLPRFALVGAEPVESVEFAAFLDATADGRHNNHGGGDFYKLAEALEALIEHEQLRALA